MPLEQWDGAVGRASQLSARGKIGKAIKRQQQHQQQQSSMQRSRANLPNTYQTHQDNSRAAQVGTQLHGDGTCRAMVDSLRAFQNHPEHRLGLHSSEAKRRVAHLDSLLKNLDDERSILPTVDHFINGVYGGPAAASASALMRSPAARGGVSRRGNVELGGTVPWQGLNFFR